MITYQINSPADTQFVQTFKLDPDTDKFNDIQKFIYEHIGGAPAPVKKLIIIPEIPPELSVDKAKILNFRLGAKEPTTQFTNLKVPKDGVLIDIILDTGAIKDYNFIPKTANENQEVKIGYKVGLIDQNGKKRIVLKNTFPVNLIPALVKDFDIEIDGDKSVQIEHKVGTKKDLFFVTVSSGAKNTFASPVSGRLKVSLKGDYREFNLNEGAFYFAREHRTQTADFTLLSRQHEVLKLGFDFGKIANPNNASKIELNLDALRADNTLLKSIPLDIFLQPDSQTTKLGLKYKTHHLLLFLKDDNPI